VDEEMLKSAYSIGRAEVPTLFPINSSHWKLLQGHEIETRTGKRLPIVAVELGGCNGPLLLVQPSDGAETEQFGLADYSGLPRFIRLWIDASKGSALLVQIRKHGNHNCYLPIGIETETVPRGEAKWNLESGALNDHQVEHVDRITHIDNVASILVGGIHARNSLKTAPADIADPEVIRRRNRNDPIYNLPLNSYVPFYFNSVNPMLSKLRDIIIPSLVILRVSAKAITRSDKRWLISDGNAASDPTQFFNRIEDLEKLDWDCLRAKFWKDDDRPSRTRTRMAEMMVEANVPADWIVEIDCFSRNTMAHVGALAEALGLDTMKLSQRPNPFNS
jgi:hypothetical protein